MLKEDKFLEISKLLEIETEAGKILWLSFAKFVKELNYLVSE